MSILCVCRRKAVSVLVLSGIGMMLSGAWQPAWSAPDAPAPTDQQSSAGPADPPGAPEKGGAGKGHHTMRKACAEDAKKFCPGVKAGEGRIDQCLKQHAQELSQGCVEMMQQRAKGRS